MSTRSIRKRRTGLDSGFDNPDYLAAFPRDHSNDWVHPFLLPDQSLFLTFSPRTYEYAVT